MGNKWTDEEMEYLRTHYPNPEMECAKIAVALNRTESQVYNKAKAMGLKKPIESYILSGKRGTQHPKAVASRFGKGHIPENKGKKMPAETYEKVKHTMFNAGHIPANHRAVGSERVNMDGYIEIKVSEPSKWMLKHRKIWIEANGEIPKGYNIQFINHNSQDCRLENLRIVSRAEQMGKENSMYAKYPKELQEVMRLRGVIKRQLRKHGNE